LLLGNGKGGFDYVPQAGSGLYLDHDQKALASIHTGNEDMIILTNNNAETQLLSGYNSKGEYISMEPMEVAVELLHDGGQTQRMEIGYGGGYLAQSSRGFHVPGNVKEVRIYDFSGKRTRTINNLDI
jgi:hypothetical protein